MLLYLAFCAIIVAVEGGKSQCPGSKLTAKQRKDFLDQHNNFRSQLANGTLKNKDGEYMPQGKNMLKLRWSCKLEKSAQEWADKCTLGPSPEKQKGKVGENIYLFCSISRTWISRAWESAGKTVCRQWSEELETEYRNNPSNIFVNPNGTFLHFTQMAWGKTYKLGCGVNKDCDDGRRVIVVCHYSPPGNQDGELIYEFGKPCKKSRDCETKKCDEKSGLCEKRMKKKVKN